jgi:ferredoxin
MTSSRSPILLPAVWAVRAAGLASALASAFLGSAACLAEDVQKKQPPPEFSSGYRPPVFATPPPRDTLFAYVDVAVLAACLALAAYMVVHKRSRRDLRLLVVFSIAYFGFYKLGCVCSVGSIQNVALAVAQSSYKLPFVIGAVFLLPLVFALFYGRVFCAGVCPLGAIQDIVLLRPLRVPAALDQALSLLPYFYLGAGVLFAALGSAFIFCQYDPFVGFYRMSGPQGVMLFGAALLLLGVVVGRPYCRWLCPYGVLLRWASAFSKRPVCITPAECVNCHLCADSCPFGAIVPPTPEDAHVDRNLGRRLLARAVIALPLFVAAGAVLGYLASGKIALVDRTVQIAQRVYEEETGRATGLHDLSAAYRKLGRPNAEIYREAAKIRRRYALGSALLGGWMGLVLGLRLVHLTIRRQRAEYEADRAACLACARCYSSCPVEHERLYQLGDESRRIPLAQ